MCGNIHKNRCLALLARVSLSLLCLCACVMVFGRAAVVAAQGRFAAPSGFTPRFAIADFDGDRKPDLATVQIERDAVMGSRYSIRLRLSGGEESSIRITGPLGGLQLEPRDVNGDNALDLVVTTAMASHFVAVLINDGHGNFRLARAGEFPSIEKSVAMRLGVAHVAQEEHATLHLSRSTFGIEGLTESGVSPERKSRFLLAGPHNLILVGFRRGKSARSPPVVVSCS